MGKEKKLMGILLAAVLSGMFLCACATYEGPFTPKSEAELEQMERDSLKAHDCLVAGDYRGAGAILQGLTAERTVSEPLYRMETLSLLLLQGRDAEAHDLMMGLREDLETLFDPQLEKKAQSLWHGEANKVFKGDAYERATLYAFLAMSCLGRGEDEDALRCVKNGLLADSSTKKDQYSADYALLQYLGSLACQRLNAPDDAAEYRREMCDSLTRRGILPENPDAPVLPDGSCFQPLTGETPNVLLVLWVGEGPTFQRSGEYGEIRQTFIGQVPFDLVTVAVDCSAPTVVPPKLGDLNFQATTRGGRLMDHVLANKAAAKKTAEVSRNLLLVIGSGLIVAGTQTLNSLPVGLSLLGAGGCCLVLGGVVHVVGALINPKADVRYWKNLPGEIMVVPLRLPPGRNNLFVTGYLRSDVAGCASYGIQVNPGKSLNVVHLPLLTQGKDAADLIRSIHEQFKTEAIDYAEQDALNPEPGR